MKTRPTIFDLMLQYDNFLNVEYISIPEGSVPEPFNPFDKQDKPEPDPAEDWDDDEDD